MMQRHMDKLGVRVEDRITKFTGIVTAVCFDLYGCVQCAVTPGIDKDGKIGEVGWFDEKRLLVLGPTPVMSVPDFTTPPGPGRKPPLPSSPLR